MTTVAIGEGMLELGQEAADSDHWRLRWGGDTLNTAVYLARLGAPVAYLSALGNDRLSRAMRREWAAEGVSVDLVLTRPDRIAGLYAIETDAHGERSFYYWRDQSAARALFECADIELALERAAGAELVYLSGITLSIFDHAARGRIVALCTQVRARGGTVAFDPNYRPRGWPSPAAARHAMAELAPLVSIALPTFDDERQLHGDDTPEQCQQRWLDAGAHEVVIKLGAHGACFAEDGRLTQVLATANPAPRDTTGAGDAFNAAYLQARRLGQDAHSAVCNANLLAGTVIQHSGAIIPRSAMPLGGLQL